MISGNAQPIGYTLETTADGSPTLRLPGSGESMHHSGGAATETIYIYGDVINETHTRLHFQCKTAIVGLGLGYIEIAWALSLIKNNLVPSGNLTFHSFEIVPELSALFKDWLGSTSPHPVYDLVVEKMNAQVNVTDVKRILAMALQSGSQILGDIKEFKNESEKWNLICYDAFSRKTNEELWSFEFLDLFLKQFAAAECIFTTYACTAILKKTLVLNDFTLVKRFRFASRRDSTLALRTAKG